MHSEKLKKLQKNGWTVGNADEFLELSEEESMLVDLKLRLSQAVKSQREKRELTQKQLAKQIHSSQSRVAKLEANDPSVTIDLMVKALFSAGANLEDIADIIRPNRTQTDIQTV